MSIVRYGMAMSLSLRKNSDTLFWYCWQQLVIKYQDPRSPEVCCLSRSLWNWVK